MITEVLPLDPLQPDPARLERAGEILRRGGLVAFPTETVYGLGANALDARAVSRIFTAKGRPATNPVIVHVAKVVQAQELTRSWPDCATVLARHFWPGPLTLVLEKHSRVPQTVTAGGPTVALRIPAHPVALALLEACQLPLAAPSANRSNRVSPTRAEHVLRTLEGRVDMLLDAGPVSGGLESTVLDVTVSPPRLLRPGLLTPGQIESVIGPLQRSADSSPGPHRSPGQLPQHYAPRVPLECRPDHRERVDQLRANHRIGWITWRPYEPRQQVEHIMLSASPAEYAAGWYAALYDLEDRGVAYILVEPPPTGDAWLAVHDRLRRASSPPTVES